MYYTATWIDYTECIALNKSNSCTHFTHVHAFNREHPRFLSCQQAMTVCILSSRSTCTTMSLQRVFWTLASIQTWNVMTWQPVSEKRNLILFCRDINSSCHKWHYLPSALSLNYFFFSVSYLSSCSFPSIKVAICSQSVSRVFRVFWIIWLMVFSTSLQTSSIWLTHRLWKVNYINYIIFITIIFIMIITMITIPAFGVLLRFCLLTLFRNQIVFRESFSMYLRLLWIKEHFWAIRCSSIP